MPDPSLISGPACFLYATRIDAYVVRKNRSHRVFALVASIVMTLVPIFVSIATRVAMGMVVLCFSPALLIAYALAWYDCSWKLILASGGITKSIWGVEGKCHSYQEIQAAVSGYSGADRAMIVRIVFFDGKAVKFRMDDDNAVQARSSAGSELSAFPPFDQRFMKNIGRPVGRPLSFFG